MLITPQSAHGLAFARAAEAMLRTLGGLEVAVRFASPTTEGTSEFGIANSSIYDAPISPVIVRESAGNKNQGRPSPNGGREFIVAASAITRAAQLAGYPSPIDWFAQSLGIVLDGALHPIVSVSTENFAGQPYLYRITTS